MKKRISIYIDEDVWKSVQDQAWDERVSASALVEEVLRGIRTTPETIKKKEVSEYLAEKVSEVSKDFEAAGMNTFFNPQPKERQLGKRGAK